MIKLLPKLFIKNYKNIEDPKVRNAYGKLAGIVGIITNIFLSLIKIIIGIIATSIAIIADGLNNLSDSFSSIITLFGFKMAAKPADKDHPYGHQRIEYLTGLVVSIIILLIGMMLFKSGIDKILNPSALKPTLITIIILILSILLKLWQFLFYRINGKFINSYTLVATSIDSLNDVITTFVVLISIIVYYRFQINIDGYMTLIVAIFIIINGIKLIKGRISPLIGEAPDNEFIENLGKDILSFPNVLGYHDLVVHSYGPLKTFVTVHVEVDAEQNINEAHKLIDDIERFINNKYNTNLVIHIDPIAINDEYTNGIKEIIENIIKEIDPIFRFHDFRVTKENDQINITIDLEIPANYPITNTELIDLINNKAKMYNPKFNLIIIIDIIYNDYE